MNKVGHIAVQCYWVNIGFVFQLECCGSLNYHDWNLNRYYRCYVNDPKPIQHCSVPFSCCHIKEKVCSLYDIIQLLYDKFFHSGKFSTERTFCKVWLADTNFLSEKNFEVENFQLLTMTFSENFLTAEIFLEWKWTFRHALVWNHFLHSLLLASFPKIFQSFSSI